MPFNLHTEACSTDELHELMRIASDVRREYGIDVVELTFLPKGFASHCYIAEDASGLRYFVKLCAHSRIGRRNATLLDVSLPLLAALHQPDLFPNAPYPSRPCVVNSNRILRAWLSP